MAEKRITRPLVHMVDAGEADFKQHVLAWIEANCSVTFAGKNPALLTIEDQPGTPKGLYAAYRMGDVSYRRTEDLEACPDIVDVATASGRQVEVIREALEHLRARNACGSEVWWLLGKSAVLSNYEARQLQGMVTTGDLDIRKVFVNNQYLVSKALRLAEEIVETEAARNVSVQRIDVVFNNSRANTAHKLGAYAVEMPYMLTAAYRLAGIKDPRRAHPQILENRHFNEKNRQGNYTIVRLANGVKIRLAQGLGSCAMSPNGDSEIRQEPIIERYADVALSDGRYIRTDFSPVEGYLPQYSRIMWHDMHQIRQEIIHDNMLQQIMGGLALASLTGRQPFFAQNLTISNALSCAQTLREFAANAGL